MSSPTLTRITTYAAAAALGAGVVAVLVGSGPAAPVDRLSTSVAAQAQLTDVVDTALAEDPQPQPTAGRRQGAVGGRLRGKALRQARRMLHGEFVVRTKDGFVTAFVHKGEVTAMSATSITVTSPDGYDKSYPVTADTKIRGGGRQGEIADIKVGELAVVVGTRDGDTYLTRVIGHRAKPLTGGGRPRRTGESRATTTS